MCVEGQRLYNGQCLDCERGTYQKYAFHRHSMCSNCSGAKINLITLKSLLLSTHQWRNLVDWIKSKEKRFLDFNKRVMYIFFQKTSPSGAQQTELELQAMKIVVRCPFKIITSNLNCLNCSLGTYQSAENHRNQECSNCTGKNHQKLPLLFLLILKFWFMWSVQSYIFYNEFLFMTT